MQCSTDIDVHVQSINFRAFVLMGKFGLVSQAVDFLFMPAQFHRLSHAFWELMDFVLNDGEFARLIDAAAMRLIDQCLGCIHNKIIYRAKIIKE